MNFWRLDPEEILQYSEEHLSKRTDGITFEFCLDHRDLFINPDHQCVKKGLLKDVLIPDPFLIAYIHDWQVSGLKWSKELAYSASKHIQFLEGCAAHPDFVQNDGGDHDQLEEIATFKDHQRTSFVSEMLDWQDAREMLFEFWWQDGANDRKTNADAITSGRFTQFGMACNCHPEFGKICVFEFG